MSIENTPNNEKTGTIDVYNWQASQQNDLG